MTGMFWPHFHSPWALWLLLLIPLLAAWELWRAKRKRTSLRFPGAATLRGLPRGWAVRLRGLPLALRLVALAILVVAFARPQSTHTLERVTSEGIDIMLVLDVSTSMKVMDFRPNRLEAAKQVLEQFIDGRRHDRIGLVIFAGSAMTQCPLTPDYGVLTGLLRQVDFGRVRDGTAIGTAILTATNRLRESDAKSKVMVLLTDGENNMGEVSPVTAARAAAAMGIRIYAVGMGREGMQPLEVDDPFQGRRVVQVETDVDDAMLREIAEITGGRSFRAQDPGALEMIYREIDLLERTEVETTTYTRRGELFMNLALAALALLLLEAALGQTWLRRTA